MGPVVKKRIRKWRFGPSKRPIFPPRPNHGGPRGVQSEGSGLRRPREQNVIQGGRGPEGSGHYVESPHGKY